MKLQATSETTQVASTLREGTTCLRAQDFSAVVVDQSAVDLEPNESETLLQHIGSAVPVYVSFSINSMERVVRALRVALRRREKEAQVARKIAEQELRSELRSTATAILVSCEMALESPELPSVAQTRMHTVYELAQQICGKLGIAK